MKQEIQFGNLTFLKLRNFHFLFDKKDNSFTPIPKDVFNVIVNLLALKEDIKGLK
jgi:hypothetical protein